MLLNNYVLYSNPLELKIENHITNEGTITKKFIKHYFFENKPLYTFGTFINSKINEYEDQFPSKSYNTLIDRMWGVYDNDCNYRIAINKFLEGGYTKGMFEQYLVNIVKYIFNPVTMNHKVYLTIYIYIFFFYKKKKKKKKKIYIIYFYFNIQ